MKKREISADTAEIQRKKKREYATIFYNLEEMENFLETCSPPKLTQEEIDHLNRQ